MKFYLDSDEHALKDATAEWCGRAVGSERVRAAGEHGGVDRALIRELGQLGVLRPEGPGRPDGLTVTQATVVMEELGRHLVPGPLVALHLAGRYLPDAADGTTVVTTCARGSTTCPYGADSDQVVLEDPNGLWLVDVSEGDLVTVDGPLDVIAPVAWVAGDWPTGRQVADATQASRFRDLRRLLTSSQAVGLARGALDLMVAHAQQREQFGRRIGSFQAVKHLCADALARVEVARAATHAAACSLAGLGGIVHGPSVDAAAVLATEAATVNAKTGIQIHGGMGFTWESDAHLYLKRAITLRATLDLPGATVRLAESLRRATASTPPSGRTMA